MLKSKIWVYFARIIFLCIIAFVALHFDSFPYYRAIFSIGIFAAIFYYRKAQLFAEDSSLKIKTRPKFDDRTIFFTLYFVFFLICLFDLWTKPIILVVSITGFVIYCIGTWLYSKSIAELGKMFSTGIEIKQKHELVKTGPYALARHPAYFGSILYTLGLAITANSLLGLLFFAVIFVPWLIWRMKKEEQELAKEFGKEFQEYKKKTKLLIPKII